MIKNYLNYIDGKWVKSSSGKTFDNRNPATGELIAKFQLGSKEDVNRAVKAAKKAFVDLERFSTGFTTINTRRIGNAPGKYPTKHKLMSKHYEK